MPYFLSDFLKRNPGRFDFDVNKKQVLESLENNEVDFSLVSVSDSIQIDKVELLPNELYMMVNAEQTFEKIFIRCRF
jgi:hypothetical protein